MRESANQSENRLLYYLNALNAALGTTLSFAPSFYIGSVKTSPKGINKMADDVKTEQLRNALWAVCYTAKSQLDGMGRGKEPSPRLQGALDRAAELLGFDPTLERPEFDDD